MSVIHVITQLPLHVFLDTGNSVTKELREAEIGISLGADTVARTAAMIEFQPWFQDHGHDWETYFACATYHGDDEWILSDAWEDIDTDIRLTWYFEDDDEGEKALALLFKLTFGGK